MTDAPPKNDSAGIDRLLSVMARLRDPDGGCPWDIEQTFETIAPYTIEEAYEVADAVTRGDLNDLKEELGDLLLQVVFHAQIAADRKAFDFDAVANGIADKLISRHPHVFGDKHANTAADVVSIWDAAKKAEKQEDSAIGGVTLGLPALLRAQKLQKKAAKAGFVWPDTGAAWAKVEEELAEFKSASTKKDQAEELGDLLFCIVNYARMAGHDAEEILAQTNMKFEQRFKVMESVLKEQGEDYDASSLDQKLQAWNAAKTQGKR
jgi:MazG family protein